MRLAPRPAYLAGREQLLAELKDRLADVDAAGPRIVALHGLGGTGKTSIAVTYAHQRQADLGLVWQFPAENEVDLAAGFAALAAELGAQLGDSRDPVALVHGMLGSRPGGWLLIFDNAPDAASVAGALPPSGDGQVIITSRSAHWPGGTGIEVPVLDQDVAAGFLQARTGNADWAAAQELAGT